MVGQSRMTAKHGESQRRQKKKKKKGGGGVAWQDGTLFAGSASVVVGGIRFVPGSRLVF